MDDLNKMKVTELKQALKDRGLPSSGTKPELVKRLGEALGATVESSNDASLEGIDEDEILNEDPPAPSQPVVTPKVAPASNVEAPANPVTAQTNGDASKPTDHIAKPAEASKMSDAERLKLRAEKFGVVSAEAKKEMRAQRFGLPSTTSSAAAKLGSAAVAVDMDKLKKRAERFGTVVSSSLSKADEDERKRKRAERFGSSGDGKSSISIVSTDDAEAKKRKRQKDLA